MIRIYDGNNYYRRVLETNMAGMAPRQVLTDTIHCSDVQIWVWDGQNGNAKRRSAYPEYKANRTAVRKDIYAGFEVVKEVLKHTDAFQISVAGYEGDDVIATLARKYAGRGEQVSIYSTDFDFIQLTGEFPNSVFCGARLKEHVPGTLVRHYKTWVGDPSDNIRGIPGFGDVTWQRTDTKIIQTVTQAIISSDKPTFSCDGLSQKVTAWLTDSANLDTFRTYWNIIGFYDIPDDVISANLIKGQENYEAANNYLKEFFL